MAIVERSASSEVELDSGQYPSPHQVTATLPINPDAESTYSPHRSVALTTLDNINGVLNHTPQQQNISDELTLGVNTLKIYSQYFNGFSSINLIDVLNHTPQQQNISNELTLDINILKIHRYYQDIIDIVNLNSVVHHTPQKYNISDILILNSTVKVLRTYYINLRSIGLNLLSLAISNFKGLHCDNDLNIGYYVHSNITTRSNIALLLLNSIINPQIIMTKLNETELNLDTVSTYYIGELPELTDYYEVTADLNLNIVVMGWKI